ncbi:MAG: hypothetical protein ACRDFS_01395 [Chloroflexota bacterium]
MTGTASIRGDVIDAPQREWAAISGEEDDLYAGLGPGAQSSHYGRAGHVEVLEV